MTQAQAGLSAAQAQLRNARANVERTRSLAEQGTVPQAQLDEAEEAFETATAGLAQAQFIEYDGAPHGLTASHKDRLSQDLLAFVRQ